MRDLIFNIDLWARLAGAVLISMAAFLVGIRIIMPKRKQDRLKEENPAAYRRRGLLTILGLVAMGYLLILSFFPIALHALISFHEKHGNDQAVSFLSTHGVTIVLGMWLLLSLALPIALPPFLREIAGQNRAP